VDRLKTRLSFQISVNVRTLDLDLTVASAALAGGVDIVKMGTPLLKTQGVSNVVPAFRKRFPDAAAMQELIAANAQSVIVGFLNSWEGNANTCHRLKQCTLLEKLFARQRSMLPKVAPGIQNAFRWLFELVEVTGRSLAVVAAL
jgi:hypothetical protein